MNFFAEPPVSRKVFAGIFLLKVLMGVALWAIYTFYYTNRAEADIYKYFDDSAVMFNALKENPDHYIQMLSGINEDASHLMPYYADMTSWDNKDFLYNDNRTMIRLNAFFRLFSFGFYHVHSVFMVFLSFIGLTGIFKIFNRIKPGRASEFILACFLLPSILFWTSGVLKDSLLISALGLTLFSLYKLLQKYQHKYLLLLVISMLILLFIKLYIIIAILPGMIAWLWSHITGYKKVWLKFAIAYLIYFTVGLNIHYVFPDYDVVYLIYLKQHNFLNLAADVGAGSVIDIYKLEPNFQSLLISAPEAFKNTLFRPYFFESFSPLILLAGIENLLLIIILIFYLFHFTIILNDHQKPLLWFSIFFVIILFVLIGLVTPVMGAMVRYKAPALPFLIGIFIILSDNEKINSILLKITARFRKKSP
ncbi:MAG: hypothetical protein ACR2GN_07755 [Bacteroidia bacterium]